MEILETTCQSALHRLKRKIPYGWDCNCYRGCSHQCCYCYAMNCKPYNEIENSQAIVVKTNIVEELEKELSSPNWKREVINLGGVTDSYQAAEAQYQLMPEILKLLIRYKTPAIISTKSDLILRDFELIAQLAEITYINIAETITVQDETIRQIIEPNAVSAQRRFDVLQAFSQTKASVGLHTMPIIPYLTDHQENLEWIMSQGQRCHVDYFLPGVLYLRGQFRQHFFQVMDQALPSISQQLKQLYQKGAASPAYKTQLYARINELRVRYQLSSHYMQPMRERLAQTQTHQFSLFE